MIVASLTKLIEDERDAWDARDDALTTVANGFASGVKVPYIFDIFGMYAEVEDKVIEEDPTDEGAERAVKAVLEAYRAAESAHSPTRPDKIDMDDISMGVAGDDGKLLIRFIETDDEENLTEFGKWLQALLDADNDKALSDAPQNGLEDLETGEPFEEDEPAEDEEDDD